MSLNFNLAEATYSTECGLTWAGLEACQEQIATSPTPPQQIPPQQPAYSITCV